MPLSEVIKLAKGELESSKQKEVARSTDLPITPAENDQLGNDLRYAINSKIENFEALDYYQTPVPSIGIKICEDNTDSNRNEAFIGGVFPSTRVQNQGPNSNFANFSYFIPSPFSRDEVTKINASGIIKDVCAPSQPILDPLEADTKGKRAILPIVSPSSIHVEECSDNPAQSLKRNYCESDDCEGISGDLKDESVDARKAARGKEGTSSKRGRVAEVHNLSERRRRDRINEKMHALQELIPNCNKVDKASVLDEAIEYIKTLQLQVQQIMSMQQQQATYMPRFSPTGMGFGPAMVPMAPMPLMQGAHFLGPSFRPIHGPTSFRPMVGPNFSSLGCPFQGLPLLALLTNTNSENLNADTSLNGPPNENNSVKNNDLQLIGSTTTRGAVKQENNSESGGLQGLSNFELTTNRLSDASATDVL